ncbi:MAG: septation protein A [Zoogloeaceae bacterium]|jgi:intracellular septation protein|nr:septation protein A [Zoogloeaceae bacterium]
MKLLFDLFPVILFFVAFHYAQQRPDMAAEWVGRFLGETMNPAQAPILLATVVVMLAALLQIAYVLLRHGKVEKMLLLSFALVIGFGGLTVLFQNETFIKWKPTALYWAMAASMSIAALCKRNAMRLMLSDKIDLPKAVWLRLNFAWIGFFLFMGALNLFVAYRYPTEIWVNFKLFGGMGLLLLFALAQGVYLSRFIKEDAADPHA